MSVVTVSLTHSIDKKSVLEKRYVLSQTIAEIKANLATHFATPADKIRLAIKNEAGQTVETSADDSKMLGYYQVRDGWTLHIADTQERAQWVDWDDVSKVEKYMMSEEEYDKREGTLRDWKRKQLEQARKEAEAQGIELPPELGPDSFKEEAEKISVGDRCQCMPGDRLGTVRYVGRLPALKPGFWVGVEFDEPVGKSDGTVKGAQVFECRPQYGGFLRPKEVEVGDFPPEEF